MSKLSFRARALDASKPMPIYLAEDLPDLPEYSAINRAVPQMPSGMEKEEECEHHLQRAICTGLIIPTPEVCDVNDLEFYERCYPPDYKMPKQHIHMQPLWQEQETPEYDIDSEDERWLKQQRHPELTELKFEQMMDKLERSSGQTVVTLNEAKLLLERHDDLVIAVYDYWLNKRLKTQHPLILSVKTESRPGQSTNNPYLAFRRRTEKMQTRKNRKNDESSYEKMLKLRRDLARALTLLELVARREKAKRDLVRLTALLAERRYHAGDFTNQMLPEPPSRPQYTAVHVAASSAYRRETFSPHYPPRAPPTPVDQPRQREKRPYKRRKHRHHAVGSVQGLRDSGVYTSSEEESTSRAEVATPPDDGPFTFRRKAGCYYEMPTSTLCGDPVDPSGSGKQGLYQHELNEKHRYTLTSVNHPYPHCVGFARRRLGRGGRVILDRISTPLDDLWSRLSFEFPGSQRYRQQKNEEVELETKIHRNPKELTRDYHTSGKYPWRHAFRQHLARNPDVWVADVKDDIRFGLDEFKFNTDDVKVEPMDIDRSLPQDSVNATLQDTVRNSEISIPQDSVSKSDISLRRTLNSAVSDNLKNVIRKRSWSVCSDSSYDSDDSLEPVEKEFEGFISEVNKKWLHFRPKTPPPSLLKQHTQTDDYMSIADNTPIAVELSTVDQPPSGVLDSFTTSEFTLGDLYGDVMHQEQEHSGSSLDISGEDLLTENFTGLTEAQVESILTETGALANKESTKVNKKVSDDLLDELLKDVDAKDSFLSQGQSLEGRASSGPKKKIADDFGSTVVQVSAMDKEPIYVERLVKVEKVSSPKKIETPKASQNKAQKEDKMANDPAPVPMSNIIVEEVNEVPQIRVEKIRKQDTIDIAQKLAQGIHLQSVQTKTPTIKKHIITSAAHRRSGDITLVTSQETPQPQIVTVAVTDSLKVRLQNHLASNQHSANATVVGVVQNGPFASPTSVAVALPVAAGVSGVSGAPSVVTSSASPRRAGVAVNAGAGVAVSVGAGVSQTLHKPLTLQHSPVVVAQHALHHVPPNKLKVLHATPLTHTQRTQLLAGNRATGITQLVSLATLGDAKTTNTALLKAAPGSVAQFFEIKSGQLSKGPHLVNVVRQPAPGKTVARLDLNDKKRQVAFDGTLKGNIATASRHRLSVLDGRQLVRATVPVRPQVTRQIQIKNRLQVAPQITRSSSETSGSITIAPTKSASIPSSVAPIPSSIASIPTSMVNLLQKNVHLPKGGQRIAISGPAGHLSANVQAIAFSAGQLKARQARLIAQPRTTPVAEIVEATTAPVATSSNTPDTPLEGVTDGDETTTNGAVRRRTADTLPMEVT